MAGSKKCCEGLHFFDHLRLTTDSGCKFDSVGFGRAVFDQDGHQVGPVSHSGIAPGFAEKWQAFSVTFSESAESDP